MSTLAICTFPFPHLKYSLGKYSENLPLSASFCEAVCVAFVVGKCESLDVVGSG